MSTLHEIRQVVDDRLRRLNTCCPGRVDSYDATLRLASVTPLIQEHYADGTVLVPPSIPRVPVVMPGGATYGLALPIATGDTVLLVFAQRSIDTWKSLGGSVEAGDTRMHALSDAIAVAGLYPASVSHADGAGVLLHNGLVKMRLDGGKVAVGTTVVELLDRLTVALDLIGNSICPNGLPLSNSVAILAASTALKTIKGTI